MNMNMNNNNDQQQQQNNSIDNYQNHPRYVRKKQAMQELREIQNNRGKLIKKQINQDTQSSKNISGQNFKGKHNRQNSYQNNNNNNNNNNFSNKIHHHNNQNQNNKANDKYQQNALLNDNSYQANHVSTAFNEQDLLDVDDDTAANSATLQNQQQQQPSEKLKSHLKDLAQLESDLNRLKSDQQMSKNNFEKMKMHFRKNHTRSRLRQNNNRIDDINDNTFNDKSGDDIDFSDVSNDNINHNPMRKSKHPQHQKKDSLYKRGQTQGGAALTNNRRKKVRNNSFDYYNDSQPHSNGSDRKDSPHQSYTDSQQSQRRFHNQKQNKQVTSKATKGLMTTSTKQIMNNSRGNNHNKLLQKQNKSGFVNDIQKQQPNDTNELSIIQQRLRKECKGDLGIVNPLKAFSILNMIQKEDCPEAYEPEIVLQHKQRQEEKKRQDQYLNEMEKFQNDIDKTLFDFDEDIDKLSNVSERYQVQGFYIVNPQQQQQEQQHIDSEKLQVSEVQKQNQTLEEINHSKIRFKDELQYQDEQGHHSKSRSRQKSNKKQRKSQLNFTLDEAKAEMIKDLRQKSKNKNLDDSIDYNNDNDGSIIKQNKDKPIRQSRQNYNEKLIQSIKQRRNIFNHQPQRDINVNSTSDNLFRSTKNRINIVANSSSNNNINGNIIGQQSMNAFNRYKGSLNGGNLLNIQNRLAVSAYPGERSKREQKDDIQISQNNSGFIAKELIKKREKPDQIQIRKQNPQSLERPAMNIVNDIYGKIQKENYQPNSNINKTMLIYENPQSRPLTSNNRMGGSQKPNLFNPSHQKNLIYNPTLQMPSLYNQQQQQQQRFQFNQSPFQFLNPAFSEVALNQSVNTTSNNGYQNFNHHNSTCYPGISQQQSSNLHNTTTTTTSGFIPSKNGTLYPGITAKHKHIDRLEKYFCTNTQNKTNKLKQQHQIIEQQRKHMQQIKYQQQNLIGTSINFGDAMQIAGSQFNTMTNQGLGGGGNMSSNRRLNQAHEFFI